MVFLEAKQIESLLNPYLIYKSQKVLGQVNISLNWIKKKQDQGHSVNFQTLVSLQTQNPLNERERGFLEKVCC